MSERNETKAYSAQPLWFETKTDGENLCRLVRHKDKIIADLNKDIDAMGRKCVKLEVELNSFRERYKTDLEEQIAKYKQQNEQLTSAIFKQESEVLTLKEENETLKAQLEIEKFKAECGDGKLNKIREIL